MLIQKQSGVVSFSAMSAFGLLEDKVRIKYDDDVRSLGIGVYTEELVKVKLDFFKGFNVYITINKLGLIAYHGELDITYTLHTLDGEKEYRVIEELDRMIERWIGDERV